MFHEDWYSESQIKNLILLYESVRDLDGLIIEIGCWEGKSTIALANACYPENLICNDTWLGNQEESIISGNTHITEIILQTRDVYSIFKKNMDSLTQGNYSIVKQDCLEWLKGLNKPVKFCHIDASHEYDSVYKTIEYLKPLMVHGGILCGDDFLNAHKDAISLKGGVEKAVSDSLTNYDNIDNLWFWKKEY